MKIRIYDTESYPNYFLLGILDVASDGTYKKYFISDLDRIAKINFDKPGVYWIGFNNRRYDQPVLDFIKRMPNIKPHHVYEFQRKIIHGEHEKDPISWNKNIIDLYEIMPLPGIQKCSLKEIGHRLRYEFLEDLPYQDKEVSDEDIEKIKEYNLHDLLITYKFWHKIKPVFESRQIIKKLFRVGTEFGGIPNIGKKVLLKLMGDECSVNVSYKLEKMDNLILSEDLRAVYNDCFSKTLEDYENDKVTALGKVYNIKGCKCKLLQGGLHGIIKPGIYHNVYEYDVTSYYPNLLMNCNLGSDTFRVALGFLFDQRKKFIESGDKASSDALKLVLNSLTGNLANKKYGHPRIKSESAALSMRLLGQFYLMDLIEKLPQNECLVANTDGIFVKNRVEYNVLKEWQERTGFSLTEKSYRILVLSDVNSYYTIDSDGKEKRKKEFLEPRWDRNVNAPIIQKAVLNLIIKNIPIDHTLNKEKDIYNFCYFSKVANKDGNCLLLNDQKIELKKIRYFVSNSSDSVELKKIVNGRTMTICKDYKISMCNDLTLYDGVDFKHLINLEFYRTKVLNLLTKLNMYGQ